MKHYSYILALLVLLLSTAPCFLQDKCLFHCSDETQEDACGGHEEQPCSDCCSPFLHCNTCTSCPEPPFVHSLAVAITQLVNNSIPIYKEKLIPQFSISIWQPPKIAVA